MATDDRAVDFVLHHGDGAQRGRFHGWTRDSEGVLSAVVEDDDSKDILTVPPHAVVFRNRLSPYMYPNC